ncbi:4-hydroxy-2-oxovalerate aldolase [Pseudomonas sp. D47]|uniref:4-hydroxy-2-oxovalerate aldolase n=1 Tax=Pseudomonas sp. D47 TaxID=3159447 RepID=UPI00387B23A2
MNILINDSTLRDGQHAVKHQLTVAQLRDYATAVDKTGVAIVEVGHGNGLGASSYQVGRAALSDETMLTTVRESLRNSKMGVFMLPGWGVIADLSKALSCGAEVVRIGTHCTEATLAERHLGWLRERGAEAHAVLMMSHMATPVQLAAQAELLVGYGAQAVGIMDSAGNLLPQDVTARIAAMRLQVDVPLIFHAHNNLGMAVANSVAAAEAGATVIDGCACGFGAGAGNTQLEVLIPVLARLEFDTGIDLYQFLDAAELVARELMVTPPMIDSMGIVSGLAGVFSGFKNPVLNHAGTAGIDPRDVFFELGRRQVVAGQEDIIVEVVAQMKRASM